MTDLIRLGAVITLALYLPYPLPAQEGARPAPTKQKIFRAGDAFLGFQMQNLETIQTNDGGQIRLVRRSDEVLNRDDVAIDFESEALFLNPAHQNLLQKASLERESHNGMSGMAARFSLSEHQLKLRLPTYLNLSGKTLTRESGDFSFACEFEPQTGDAEILRRENFAGGKHYLMSVSMRNRRLVAHFQNLLSSEKVLESAELIAVEKVRLHARNDLVLSYSEGEGMLRLYLNGREQAVYALKRLAGGNFILTLENLAGAPWVLFSPFRGFADNVLFSNRVLGEADIRHFGALKPYGDRYEQRTGLLLSRIYDMGFSQSTIVSIDATAQVSRENKLETAARCSDRRFDPDLAAKYLRFEALAELSGKKCRFIQFRALFTADNAGQTSPLLSQLRIEYRENPPPERPARPRIIAAKGESLELELVPNTEVDVIRGGRYLLYYGHKAHQIEGAVYFDGKDAILHRMPLRLKITNDTLAQNKVWADKNPRFKHRYPVFGSGVGYYFWVTACDNAWSDAQEHADHESQPSEAVFARFE